MIPQDLVDLSYLAAAILFIFALKMMASPRSARTGNLLGAVGMLVAIVFTLGLGGSVTWTWIIVGMIIGSAAGAYMAVSVQMTAMPQMVALLNGFGGLASALVVVAEAYHFPIIALAGANQFATTVALSTLIGWVTFTGSVVAFLKLQEWMTGRPIVFPHQKTINFALLGVCLAGIVLWGVFPEQRWIIIPLGLLSAAAGVLLVIPIGGADMPVVISLLNSYSGLAAAATGFVLGNAGLIISGALVGASGIILTRLMCVAMNRSLANVLFGAVGQIVEGPGGAGAEQRRVTSWSAEDAAMALTSAAQVVIVPGYGMAVAQAQHAIKELADLLDKRGVTVKFGIHPVAGRMPGHMNVLLAEAEVPYDRLLEMSQINPEFDQTDVVLVIGANDVVNPAARHDKSSPIYGMPILDVDKARTVMVCKRSLNPGFAGIDNELFYHKNTAMLFGDAKSMVSSIVAAVKGA